MTDIVGRLERRKPRDFLPQGELINPDGLEAAAEIRRLREAVDHYADRYARAVGQRGIELAEQERRISEWLRASLEFPILRAVADEIERGDYK